MSSTPTTSNVADKLIQSDSTESLKFPEPPDKRDYWAAALGTLSQKDVNCLSQVDIPANSRSTVLQDLLDATNKRKDECMKKRWKATIKGQTVILRDIAEKISVWIGKIIKIGDIAIQYDPVTAALPWAAVRLIMQATVNDVEVFGYVLHSLEAVTNTIARCQILDLLYCQPQHEELAVSAEFSKAFTLLYSAILHYLASIIRFFQDSTGVRFLKSTVFSKGDIEAIYANIESAKQEVWSLAQLAEAEKTESVLAIAQRLEKVQKSNSEKWGPSLDNLDQLFQELQEPINRASNDIEAIKDDLERHTRGRILKAISSIPHRLHHKTAKKGRLEGSGQWLLRKPAFRQWREASSSSVIWLHGIPGSGKTKLTSRIIDEIEDCENLTFFYCMRNPAEPQRGQCDQILASLVRQLAATRSNSAILPPIVARYEDALSGFTEFEDQHWTSHESREALVELMQEYPSVTIVLDALDEVQPEDRRELMDTLSWLLQNAPNLLKIFISSRDNYDISLHLQGSPNIYIEADDNAGDIEAFIETEIDTAKLLNGRLSDELRTEIVVRLLEGARGMFRWVALQIQSLRVLKLAADIQARLGVLPATLEESYWEVYQQINASGAHATNLATFTFRWLMYAKRTESIEDFAAIASSYLSEGGSKYTVEEVIDVCSNLVVQRSGTESFEFAHLSVREFLESVHRRGVDLFLSTPSNSSLASACIQHIKLEVEKELATWKEEPVADAAGGPVPKITSLLQHYTTLNWYLHVQDSNENGRLEHLSKLLQTFILGEDGSGRLSRSFRSWWQMLPTEEKKSLGDTGTEPSNDHVAYPRKLVRMVCVLGCPETVELVCKYRRLTLNDGKSEGLLVNDQSASWLEDLLDAFRYVVRRLVIRDEMEVVDCIGRYLLETARAGTSSPLVIAVELDSLNAVRRLLHQEHGGVAVEALAVVNAARRDSIQALQLLIDHDKTAIQQAGQEAVRASVAFDSVQERKEQDGIEVVTALLDNDVPISSGDELIFRATAVNHPALVQLLLNRGIGMGAISQALVLSISDGNDEITELLLHHGAKKTDSFAVIRALKQDTPTTAVRLIRAGYAYRGRYLEKARTALHYAAEKGFPEVAAILLERNTPMDLFDRDRKTPLHLAAEKGRHDCVQLLLKAGADVLIEDGAGNIALDLAERKGFEKTANSIRGHMEQMLEDLKEKQKHRRDIQHQDT